MKQSLIDEITMVLQNVPVVTNLARKKFIAQFTIGLIKSRNIQFCEIAGSGLIAFIGEEELINK